MKRWAYVQAMVDHNFDDCHKPGETLPVCFRQTIVEAEDEASAYVAGHQWGYGQPKVDLLNDFAFEV